MKQKVSLLLTTKVEVKSYFNPFFLCFEPLNRIHYEKRLLFPTRNPYTE